MDSVGEERDLLDIPALIAIGFFEIYAERLQPLCELLHGGHDDRTGVDSTAQMAPERHIAHQLHLDAFIEEGAETAHRLRLFHGLLFEMQIPVLADFDSAVLCDEEVPRRKELDSLEKRLVAEHVLEGQVVCQGPGVQFPCHRRVREEAFDFRRERDASCVHTIVERFDSKAIPDENEALPALVPDRKGEHSVELMYRIGPLLLE